MKKALLMTLAAATFALPAMAATSSPVTNAATPAAMTKTYDKADLNKDGKVSKQELKAHKKAEMAAKHATSEKDKAVKAVTPATTNE